jgi:tetratricopeptide (TPR) repeat protein
MNIGKLFLLTLFFLCLSTNLFSQNVDELIKKSDEMYTQIKSVNDFDPLIKFLKDAEWNNKNNYELTWRVGRALSEKAVILFLSYLNDNMKVRKIKDIDDILDSDKDLESSQEKNLLELGKEARYYMDKAKTLNSSRVETFYYGALSISMYGLGKSIISALMEGLSGKLEDALKNAEKINKGYLEGAALRQFGRYYYVLPWPKRDLDESEKYLKEAVQVGPINILNHMYLGDTFWKLDKKTEAKNAWQNASKVSGTTTIERIIFDKLKNMINKRLSLN